MIISTKHNCASIIPPNTYVFHALKYDHFYNSKEIYPITNKSPNHDHSTLKVGSTNFEMRYDLTLFKHKHINQAAVK